MTYEALKQEAEIYRGALQMETVISGERLRAVEKCLRIIVVCIFFGWGIFFLASNFPLLVNAFPTFSAFANEFYPLCKGAFFLFFGLWLFPALFNAFFASSYFKDARAALPEAGLQTTRISYEVARVLSEGHNDPVLDFFSSTVGGVVSSRLGLTGSDVVSYLQKRQPSEKVFDIPTPEEEPVALEHFAKALLLYDESLTQFFASHKLEASDFIGASAWVSHLNGEKKNHLRWWSKDALGRIPGVGKNWAYGEIAMLSRYAVDITLHPDFASFSGVFGRREATEIERVLSRGRESNVLIVAEEGVPRLAPLVHLSRKIMAGRVFPQLEYKRIFVFDGVPFLSAMKEKAVLETELVKLLSEVAQAGNIIFVFDNFDVFFQGAKALGSDVLSILDPFLASANIQIAALSELGAFRQLFEPNPKIKARFERVLIEGASVAGSLPIVEDEASKAEVSEKIFFTFPALRSITESAERYFFDGVMPDKAVDLLREIVPKVKATGKHVVLKEDVLDLVSQKTGIAVSEAKGEERTKLLKLEETLHERIVGQDEAVKAISGALRRSRSGISSPNRPMGSFLFLGPTGVGKTETTKALAQVFFGDEKAIMRLDMSEYQSEDALNRLIGTFESGKAGVLASLLREKPFGVLLLDEFEKTNKDVHDLFLQILDEGFFTDVTGKRVNARNLIIIATSNAGSDVIWKTEQEGRPLSKDIVITDIISKAIFKPELLNRFDGVVLFHSLTMEHLRVIAKLSLQKLAKRLKEKGLELSITDSLLDYLVSTGQDPKFGARPMNRAIQENVEQIIAEKMLRGDISAGSKVELSSEDLRGGKPVKDASVDRQT
ncbi:MAG: ATP-dependent Clp protease ATP-binding subunit [Candidatus Taylorbacteria bacterium]|nr:ATP-dependent Clp protease ATP-binding subunit [Candidatus Taylorbacteria bacterium]